MPKQSSPAGPDSLPAISLTAFTSCGRVVPSIVTFTAISSIHNVRVIGSRLAWQTTSASPIRNLTTNNYYAGTWQTLVGKGITDRDGDTLRNFEIAGTDRKFVPAEATISGNNIKVRAASVSKPVAVRHAWHMNIDVDLANSDELTGPSFRTDSWLVAPGRRIRMACIGDSITFGAGLKNPAGESYPAQLALLLGDAFEVRGFGKSGFGTHRPAKKYDQTREFRDALAYEPDIVIRNLGINDITQSGTYSRSDLVTEYRKLIDAFACLATAPYIIQWSPLAPLFPGQTFHDDKAKRLLETTDEPIIDVAAAVGFEDPANFTRMFRRIAGVNPRRYRRMRRSPSGGSTPRTVTSDVG